MLALHMPGISELLIIGFLLVFLFGAKRASGWATSIVDSVRLVRKTKKELDDEPK